MMVILLPIQQAYIRVYVRVSVYTKDPPKFRWISGNQQYLDCDTKIPETGFGYCLKTFLPVYLRRLLVFLRNRIFWRRQTNAIL